MLADLRTGDAIARTAVERIEIFDPSQQRAGSGDRWCHVIGDPLCHGLGIRQRRVAGGERATRRRSGRSTASTLMTSVAMHCPGPVMGGDGSKAANSASRNWHGEGESAVSGARDCSPGTITGRSRGSGTVSATVTEVAASKATVTQRVLAHMFRSAATVRRACIRHGSSNVLQAHFAISAPSAANSGNRSTVRIRNPPADRPAFNLRHL